MSTTTTPTDENVAVTPDVWFDAVSNGNLDLVSKYLQQNAGLLELLQNDGQTALMIACKKKQTIVMQHLIENNANVNVTSPEGWSITHVCAYLGNMDTLMVLLKFVPISMWNLKAENSGLTPLHFAVLGNNLENMLWLLQVAHAAPVEPSLLLLACRGGNLAIVEFLLDEELGFVDESNEVGDTPLLIAAKHKHDKLALLLLQRGCKITEANNEGADVLTFASKDGLIKQYFDSIMILHMLLQKGAGDDVSIPAHHDQVRQLWYLCYETKSYTHQHVARFADIDAGKINAYINKCVDNDQIKAIFWIFMKEFAEKIQHLHVNELHVRAMYGTCATTKSWSLLNTLLQKEVLLPVHAVPKSFLQACHTNMDAFWNYHGYGFDKPDMTRDFCKMLLRTMIEHSFPLFSVRYNVELKDTAWASFVVDVLLTGKSLLNTKKPVVIAFMFQSGCASVAIAKILKETTKFKHAIAIVVEFTGESVKLVVCDDALKSEVASGIVCSEEYHFYTSKKIENEIILEQGDDQEQVLRILFSILALANTMQSSSYCSLLQQTEQLQEQYAKR